MPQTYTRTDQVKFLTDWFDGWSELQRDDFLPILVQILKPGEHVNGLVNGVGSLVVGGERRPSIFDCQVKLFQDWYETWTEDDKQRLLHHFSEHDPEFNTKLNNKIGTVSLNTTTITNLTTPETFIVETSPLPDDGVSQGSRMSSSPLSSMSQSFSPMDSGLEETEEGEPEPISLEQTKVESCSLEEQKMVKIQEKEQQEDEVENSNL